MSDDQWIGFLEKALWGLEQAAERLRNADTRAQMELAGDWWRKAKKSGAMRGVEIPEENAVTSALQDLFDEICSEQEICGTGGMDLRHFHFHAERRRKTDPNRGRMTKPTDIAIIFRAHEAYDLRIEAKTLVHEAEIASQYMSDHGLLRFEDPDNPYTDKPYGGMIAYIVKDDTETWSSRVLAGLQTEFGDTRVGQFEIGATARMVSQHSYESIKDGRRCINKVAVIHLVAEIEARPSQRSPRQNTAASAGS